MENKINNTEIVLSEDAKMYLVELMERNEFVIENDIFHCEIGANELIKVLKQKKLLKKSFCKDALNN